VVRWLREQAHKASIEDDKDKLRWLERHLANRELETINRGLIDAITEAKRAERCSNATANRTLALVRAILRKCVRDWEWLDRAPAVRLLKEPSRRIRFLTRHQAIALLKAGVDFATISQWLGHAGLNTTMRYARADLDLKRQAISQVFPDALVPPRAGRLLMYGSDMVGWLRRP
jgi:site-specific recombinase XerD